MLLSVKDDGEDDDDVRPMFPWRVISWCASKQEEYVPGRPVVDIAQPIIAKPSRVDAASSDIPVLPAPRQPTPANATHEHDDHQASMHPDQALMHPDQALMHPDIAVSPVDLQAHANLTADIETA